MEQATLFNDAAQAQTALPEGLVYQPAFLSADEEAALIALVGTLPLAEANYKGYSARRRVLGYGGSFDYETNRLRPAEAIPGALHPLRDRVAAWAGLPCESLGHALVAEYRPGTPLGWHRDVPDFEDVIGVSLGSTATLRFRPYLPSHPPPPHRRGDVLHLQLAPRSVYRLQGAARWDWQHSVPPVPAQRWSITFRTLAVRQPRRTTAPSR